MSNTPFVLAGNWKMHLARDESLALAAECSELAECRADLQVIVFPSLYIAAEIAQAHAETPLLVGAQNLHEEPSGAFTGEVSATQWKSAGVERVLIGHSERRNVFGECTDRLAKKVVAAREAGLHVTYCVGEHFQEREAGRAEVTVGEQLAALTHLPSELRSDVDVAYEPVWAIGTGQTATPELAEDMHRHIRRALTALKGCENARLLYGGSVKPENASELAAQPNVDGFLVGGASLKAESFRGIAEAATAAQSK